MKKPKAPARPVKEVDVTRIKLPVGPVPRKPGSMLKGAKKP